MDFAYDQATFSKQNDFSESELDELRWHMLINFDDFEQNLKMISYHLPEFIEKIKNIKNFESEIAILAGQYLENTLDRENRLLSSEAVAQVSLVLSIMELENVIIHLPGVFSQDILKLAISYHIRKIESPKSLKYFLKFILQHREQIGPTALQEMFSQTTSNKLNAFLVLVRDFHEFRSFAFNFQGGFKNNFKFCEIAAFITCQSCA